MSTTWSRMPPPPLQFLGLDRTPWRLATSEFGVVMACRLLQQRCPRRRPVAACHTRASWPLLCAPCLVGCRAGRWLDDDYKATIAPPSSYLLPGDLALLLKCISNEKATAAAK